MAELAHATVLELPRRRSPARAAFEEPETLLVEDGPLLFTVAGWATVCDVVLAVS